MMRSKTSSKKPHNLKLLIIIMMVISFLGFSDATYLASEYYLGKPITCSILKGCEVVTTSQYSKILGIPVSLFGSLYYLTILLGIIFYLDSKKAEVLKYLGLFTVSGFIASLYFVFLQAFVIQAYCIYCLFSATTSTLLFILGMYLLRLLRVVTFEGQDLEDI